MSIVQQGSEQEQQWFLALEQAWLERRFERVILSQYQGEVAELEKITFKTVEIQQQRMLSCTYRYKTQDLTKNYLFADALLKINQLLTDCKQANLFLNDAELQLKKNKKKVQLIQSKKQAHTVQVQAHNREKQRHLALDQAYLHDLGICDQNGNLIPSMAKKWKQINKFTEIFSNAVGEVIPDQKQIDIVDFGSGKGYLTFAMYDYLQQQGLQPQITGVELRHNLVEFCQQVAKKNHFSNLDFFEGDVRSYQPEKFDVMVALHACDIATDFAIHCGIRLNAKIIMCAPCCHKELRPQLNSPDTLKPMLQFGIHQAQQAEMLTDTLRALLLNAYGYETKIFEFIGLEHTSKNKMILAIKRKTVDMPNEKIMQQIEVLKSMYGISEQSLQRLLEDELVDQDRAGCRC